MNQTFITAMVAAARGGPGGGVRFRGKAYGGGVLTGVSGAGGPVVFDVKGMRIPRALPLAANHSSAIENRLGSARARVVNGEVLVEGTIVGGTELADRAIALLQADGLSVSVGIAASEVERVRAGQTITVNGRSVSGPVAVYRDTELVEISAVGVGADSSATVLAASRAIRMEKQSDETNNDTIDPDQIRTAERERVAAVIDAFRGLDTEAALKERDRCIRDGVDIAEARGSALALMRAGRPGVSAIAPDAGDGPGALVACAARLLGCSPAGIRAANLPEPPARGPENLPDLCRAILHSEGREVPTGIDSLVRASFSTDAFSNVLAEALSVVGLEAFQSAEEPVLQIAHRTPLPDFKPATIARLNGQFQFLPLAPGGEIKHGIVEGDATPIRLRTMARLVKLTREAVINDERMLLSGIPRELGREAARGVGDAFAELLADGAGTFFSEARGNLLAGPDSALTVDSLTVAIRNMRKMRDASGRPLNLPPRFLLVGADLEAVARAILNSTELGTVDGRPRGNPLLKVAELLVDSRLEEGTWYLFSAPVNAAVVLATLNGAVAPVVEPLPDEPDRLGIGWRGYFDYGLALHEWRAVVKSEGE